MSETNVIKKNRKGKRTVINNDFGGSSGKSDVTLIVGDHKIPVIKMLLSMASPVFRAMFESDVSEKEKTKIELPFESDVSEKEKTETELPFESDVSEKEKTEIELPDKDYNSFVAFLNCVYPDKDETVSEQNCSQILPLAHKYQVRKLLLSCEKILLDLITRQSHTNYESEFSRNVFKTIQQAEKYQLTALETKCLYLASELPSSAMSSGLSVSNESLTEIYRLALRRYELIRQDWTSLLSPVEGSQKGHMHAEGLKEVVVNTLKSDLRYRNSIYRAARLAYYHLPKNENLKCEIISALKSRGRSNCGEEFDLLPEDLKKEL